MTTDPKTKREVGAFICPMSMSAPFSERRMCLGSKCMAWTYTDPVEKQIRITYRIPDKDSEPVFDDWKKGLVYQINIEDGYYFSHFLANRAVYKSLGDIEVATKLPLIYLVMRKESKDRKGVCGMVPPQELNVNM